MFKLFFPQRLRILLGSLEAFQKSNFSELPKFPLLNPNGDEIDRLTAILAKMAQHISEQSHLAQQNEIQQRELLANISHDLRTPLASMRGYLETLLLKQRTLTLEEQRNYLEVATKHTERLSKLISNMFDLTKLESNQIKLNLEPFAITELAQDVMQKFKLAAQAKNVRLETDFSERLPMVNADISLIERVLENMVDNALRHCEAGAVICINLNRANQYVDVGISDTGSGIAAEDLPHIFDRFYRSERARSSGSSNAGLGLTISQHILSLHGSKVQVHSTQGKGTRFNFNLKMA